MRSLTENCAARSAARRPLGSQRRGRCSPSVEIAPEDPTSADAQRCLDQYFAELDARFRGGFDRDKGGSADVDDYAPPRGRLFLVRLFGKPIGCGALRTLERGVGEIKRMWVAPQARGLGLGRRLLAELEQAARKRRMRAVRLDTNDSLAEALRLYRSSGYREIERFNDNPYAQRWFEKTLRSTGERTTAVATTPGFAVLADAPTLARYREVFGVWRMIGSTAEAAGAASPARPAGRGRRSSTANASISSARAAPKI